MQNRGMCFIQKLTRKQEAFAQHYALHGNATEAYKVAGYSWKRMKPQTLWVKASELLAHGKVSVRINELQQHIRKRAEKEFTLTADRLLQQYMRIAFADAGDFWEWDESGLQVKSSSVLTPEQRSIIQSVHTMGDKNKTIVVKLPDKLRALDALARHVGLFEKDKKTEVEVNWVDQAASELDQQIERMLDRARQREAQLN